MKISAIIMMVKPSHHASTNFNPSDKGIDIFNYWQHFLKKMMSLSHKNALTHHFYPHNQ